MVLELRTYRLKPGTSPAFVRLMRDEAVPLLEQAGVRVVRCEASLVAEDGHEEAVLIRAFASAEGLQRQEDAFYASAAWCEGAREEVLACIETYHSVVIGTSEAAVLALAKG